MTTANVLTDAFNLLIQFGFLQVVVPFLLYYSIIFGMLERTQIFARDKEKARDDKQITNIHAMIAFGIAITATAAGQAVGITQNYLPILSVTAVVLVGIMMLLGLAFGDKFDETVAKSKTFKALTWGFVGILVIGALIAVGYYSGLLVTPCVAGDGLTPVNSLNPSNGQCTRLIDITGFPTALYMMGINLSAIDFVPTLIILVVVVGMVLAIYAIVKKQ